MVARPRRPPCPQTPKQTHFGATHRPARRQAGSGRRRVPQGRRPLRPDERLDVVRPASGLEGHSRRQAAAAAHVAPFAISTSPAAPATSPSASRGRAARRPRSPSSTSMPTCCASASERASKRREGERVRFVEANAEALPFARRYVRRLYDRLRHPQRAAHRARAERGLSRAEARRPLSLPRILARRPAGARSPLRGLFAGRDPARSARSSRATARPIAISSNRSGSFRRPSCSPTSIAAAGFARVDFTRLTGGVVAIHSGWKL